MRIFGLEDKRVPLVDKCRVKLKEHGCMKMSDPCLEVKTKGMSRVLLKGLYTA